MITIIILDILSYNYQEKVIAMILHILSILIETTTFSRVASPTI